MILSIDIETFSGQDLRKCGVYKYAEDPDFEILLFAYAIDMDQTKIIDLKNGEKIPPFIRACLTDASVIKTAFNANFERVCINKYLNIESPIASWDCTRVRALMAGLPGSLKGAGKALAIEQQKMDEGAALIRYFCMPCKPTKSNGMRTRNLPIQASQDWELFKKYCMRDVDAEREIRARLLPFDIPQMERDMYVLDQEINDRGVLLDIDLVNAAISADERTAEALRKEACELGNMDNPKSTAQLRDTLSRMIGRPITSVTKEAVNELLADDTVPEQAKRLLQLRQLLGKSSLAKYRTMLTVACKDNRARGLYQFYGANRTGRFAGRLLQPQNLTKNESEPLDKLRDFIKSGDLDSVDMFFRPVPFALSELVRTAFVARENRTLIVSDFSAIEARVLAWLAGEQWRLDVFAGDGKIYEASASQMFGVPIEKITKGHPLRQKGKIAELACGYGGGIGAFHQFGGHALGLTDDEIGDIVSRWRKKSPHIVKLWSKLENAVKIVLQSNRKESVKVNDYITVERKRMDCFAIVLPSGRRLYYRNPKLVADDMRAGLKIVYMNTHQASGNWVETDTYGGKLVENVTQAVARDCLCVAMLRLARRGFNIVLHVHDEVVIEGKPGSLDEVNAIMAQPISWAPGLLLKGDGYETRYYRKD